jgi:hypothetical protein
MAENGISVRVRLEPRDDERYDVKGPFLLPTHCVACGVPLRGGATKHKPDCSILAMIRSEFGDEYAATITACEECDRAARHAYSDATTPGFFHDKCEKHRQAR